ncbi:MAG: hypothetical protein ACK5LT_13270 [Lachnospirales bacterium]
MKKLLLSSLVVIFLFGCSSSSTPSSEVNNSAKTTNEENSKEEESMDESSNKEESMEETPIDETPTEEINDATEEETEEMITLGDLTPYNGIWIAKLDNDYVSFAVMSETLSGYLYDDYDQSQINGKVLADDENGTISFSFENGYMVLKMEGDTLVHTENPNIVFENVKNVTETNEDLDRIVALTKEALE